MRIVHAIRSNAFAGVERLTAMLAAEQCDAGHEVSVVGGDRNMMPAAIDRGSVNFEPATTVWETLQAIDRWRGADILHVHMTAAEIASLFAWRAWRSPVVSTRHFAAVRGQGSLGRLIRTATVPRISAQIAVSRFVAQRIDGDSTVIYPGVPAQGNPRGALGRQRTVLIAQRLEVEKATDIGLRAFAASHLAEAGWELHIAGAGSQAAALGVLADQLDISPSVHFLGFRSDVDVLMQRAAILLAPPLDEHFGLSVVEAMAVGLPVVASASGGHLETVGAVDGAALFDAHDHQAAADLLRSLAIDPEARDRYAAAEVAVQRERFTASAHAAGVEEVYRELT